MPDPDYSLPVTYRLPREGVRVQLFAAGHDRFWVYAKRRGDTWEVDSRELPSDAPISAGMFTHWLDAPPEPGEIIDPDNMLECAADVILDAVVVRTKTIKAPVKRIPK